MHNKSGTWDLWHGYGIPASDLVLGWRNALFYGVFACTSILFHFRLLKAAECTYCINQRLILKFSYTYLTIWFFCGWNVQSGGWTFLVSTPGEKSAAYGQKMHQKCTAIFKHENWCLYNSWGFYWNIWILYQKAVMRGILPELQKPSVYAGCGNLQGKGVPNGTKWKKFGDTLKAPVLQGGKGIVTMYHIFLY